MATGTTQMQATRFPLPFEVEGHRAEKIGTDGRFYSLTITFANGYKWPIIARSIDGSLKGALEAVSVISQEVQGLSTDATGKFLRNRRVYAAVSENTDSVGNDEHEVTLYKPNRLRNGLQHLHEKHPTTKLDHQKVKAIKEYARLIIMTRGPGAPGGPGVRLVPDGEAGIALVPEEDDDASTVRGRAESRAETDFEEDEMMPEIAAFLPDGSVTA